MVVSFFCPRRIIFFLAQWCENPSQTWHLSREVFFCFELNTWALSIFSFEESHTTVLRWLNRSDIPYTSSSSKSVWAETWSGPASSSHCMDTEFEILLRTREQQVNGWWQIHLVTVFPHPKVYLFHRRWWGSPESLPKFSTHFQHFRRWHLCVADCLPSYHHIGRVSWLSCKKKKHFGRLVFSNPYFFFQILLFFKNLCIKF